MQKSILVIAGGKWQVPLVKAAKKMGFRVINSNLYVDSPAFAFADVGIVADVLDKQANLAIAREYHVSAVVTDQTDIAVETVAFINQELGLPGIKPEQAALFTNKWLMRQQLQVPGLHHPAVALCQESSQADAFAQQYGYPLVLKPLANQSSRGVNIVTESSQLQDNVKDTLQHCRDGQFLVEQYIAGTELTAEGIKLSGQGHMTLAVSRKRHFEQAPSVACELRYQPFFSEVDIHHVKQINDALYASVDNALTHAEYKVWQGKVYLIEAALRGGGTRLSSDIAPAISGVDSYHYWLSALMGNAVENLSIQPGKPWACLYFFNFAPGVVTNIKQPALADLPDDIVDYELEFSVGDTLYSVNDDRGRHGYVIVNSMTEQGLEQALQNIADKIEVQVSQSESADG